MNTAAHLRHAVMDMLIDESYQLPTKGNDICLRAAKNVAASLQTPSEETRIFCDWLITNLNKIVESRLLKVQAASIGKSYGLSIINYKSPQYLQINGKAFY